MLPAILNSRQGERASIPVELAHAKKSIANQIGVI
jgi:hypothetical protein